MTAADYVGIAGLITSTGAVIVSILVAVKQTGTNQRVDDVHDQLRTSNGRTIGEVIEANDLRKG